MKLLDGRVGLIVGIANERSLAYGIAKAAAAQGATLALTYQNERLEDRTRAIAQELGASFLMPCDLTQDAQIATLADALRDRFGRLDFVVHSVAFAKREELDGPFLNTSREGFALALDVSVYSLLALLRPLQGLLEKGSHPSVLTLSYLGAERAVPHYNVMGVAKAALESAVRYLAADLGPHNIRVNALSAGPVKTLSAAGIKGFRHMLSACEQTAPLRRNITVDDVGRAAIFALSELGSGMTGEVIHIDAGYHAVAPMADERVQ